MLIALLLFAAAFLLAAVLGRSLRHTLPLTVTGAALAVYSCTYLNHKSAAYPLLGLVLAVLALLAVRQAWQKRLTLPPAGQTLLFLGLILLLWAATRDWVPAFVDDRNHWAVFPAQMIAVERFPTGVQSCSEYADYPPLTSLFLAFLQPGGGLTDVGLLFFGQRLLYMVLCLPVLPGWPRGKSRQSKALSALGQAMFVLLIPALFSEYGAYALSPDPMMGFFTAWALITAWRARETGPDWFAVLEILAVLLALPLCKQTGILFAFMAALCVTLLLTRRVRWPVTALWWLAPAASWGSWQIMCRIRGLVSYLSEEAKTAYTLDNLAQIFTNLTSWAETLLSYLRTLALEPINNGPIGLSALGFAALLGILLWRLLRKIHERRPAVQVAVALLGCTLLFAASLCFSYMFLFVEWEREVFSAYTRYMSPFAAASTLWVLYLTFRVGIPMRPVRVDKVIAVCLLVLAVTLNWSDAVVLLPNAYTRTWGEYQQTQQKALDLLGVLPEFLQNYDGQEAPRVLITLNDVYYSPLAQSLPYLLAPSQVEGVFREDYGVSVSAEVYGDSVMRAVAEQDYNVFYAAKDVASLIHYSRCKDSERRLLQAEIPYVLQDGELYRAEA